MHVKDLTNGLWAKLDELRVAGMRVMADADFVGLLAALLYLRWLDHEEAEREAVAAFDNQDYTPELPRQLRWDEWHKQRKLTPFIQHEVVPWFARYAHSTLSHRFSSISDSLQRRGYGNEALLQLLVEWVSEIDFAAPRSREMASEALEQVLARCMAEIQRGAMLTPAPIVELMVELGDPQPGDRVYDPCFGSGGLLVACARRIREQARNLPARKWEAIRSHSLFGVELHWLAYVVGLTRLVLSGISNPGLELADALERPAEKNTSQRFDLILANPPWGGKVTESLHTKDHFRFRSKDLANLFLQHIAESLRPGGRAVVALPEGNLFKAGSDRSVRKWLLEDFRVECIISLPAGAFAPCTAIKSNLLVFRKAEPQDNVRFVTVHHLAGTSVKKEKVLSETPPEVVRRFHEGKPGSDLWDTSVSDLSLRDYELVAKSSGNEQLRKRFDVLTGLQAEVPIVELTKVSEVRPGLSYQRDCVTQEKTNLHGIAGLLRVGDLEDGRAFAPSLFLTDSAQTRKDDARTLRINDVVVSTSGSIGKVAVIGRDLAGTVAAKSLAIVRPRDGVAAQYLAALLRSDSYQKWLSGHARGSTIQHLSVRTLKHLPVPLPELPVQERVAAKWQQTGGEALTVLANVLSAGDDDILIWLEATQSLSKSLQELPKTGPLIRLERMAERFSSRLNGLDPSYSMLHLNWSLNVAHALEPLRGIHRMKPGPAMFAVLQRAHQDVREEMRELVDSDAPMVEVACEVAGSIIEDLEAAQEELLTDITFIPSLEPASIVVGTPSEVQLRLRHRAPLPLRSVAISTHPPVGQHRVSILNENETLSIPLQIPPVASTGVTRFLAKWKGYRLDGKPISGEIDLELPVESTRESLRGDELGSSPYITGSPVDREEMFFGRQNVIDSIKRQLATTHRANVILLEGNRRTGKTSILKHLVGKADQVLPGWLVVECSFQEGEGHDTLAGLATREVFRLMAVRIAKFACDQGINVWFPGDELTPEPAKPFELQFRLRSRKVFNDEYPFETFEMYVQAVLDAISPKRLLLMLDEFDKLQEGIDAGITSPQVPQNIRYLLHTYPRITAVLTGSKRLTKLREEYWSALFGLGTPIPIRALPLDEARRLVTQPAVGRLVYVSEARDRIVELCAGQPFLIQTLCNRIFEYLARVGERMVSESLVNKIADALVRDNEHFRTLWDLAETERRRLLLSLCEQLAHEADPITLPLLEAKFEEFGISCTFREKLLSSVRCD